MEMRFVDGKLCINRTFAYDVGVKVGRVAFLALRITPKPSWFIQGRTMCRSRTMARAKCYITN